MLMANRRRIAAPVHTTQLIMANAMRQNPALDSKEYQDLDVIHAFGVLTVPSGAGPAECPAPAVEFQFLLEDQ
jgi:hypothetical protein